MADRLGYVIKLLAIAELEPSDGSVSVRVHPAMVPAHHPLASVRDSFNAVFVEGSSVGQLMFYGRGAGGSPTASSILGDVIDAAVNLRLGTHGSLGTLAKATVRPIDETSAEYLVSLEVVDRPGVLHAVTGVFARHSVSIRAAEQEGIGADAVHGRLDDGDGDRARDRRVDGIAALGQHAQAGGGGEVLGGSDDV